MKKYIVSLLIIVMGLTACGEGDKNKAAEEKPIIKIGATLPLSGDSADAGNAAKAAMKLIVDDLSQKELKYDYQLFFENNEGAANKTATTTNKLISVDKVNAVFSLWNYMGSVVASIANPKNIINMTCSWEEPSLVGPYTFNAISTNKQIAGLLVDTLKQEGVKSVALLVDNSGETIIKNVIEKLKEANIKIVFNEIANFGTNDYKMTIIKANRNHPDMYVIVGAPPMPFLFVKQLKEMTGKNNVTGIDGFMEMTDEQRPIANGLWYVDSNVNGTKQFAQNLRDKYQTETQSCAGNLAASLQILINAYENIPVAEGETPSSESVVRYIKDNIREFETVSGNATLIRNNIINIKPVVRWVKEGKIVETEDKKN